MKTKILKTVTLAAALCCANFCMGFSVVANGADESRFCGYAEFVTQSETINYSRKETSEYKIKSEIPDYYRMGENTSCANIAGAVVIGYYDRFCEELMPDFKAYYQIGSGIMYRPGGVVAEQVMTSLYTLMGTDVGGAGTTFDGFQAGMKSYVNGHNYSYSTQDLGSIDFNKYKTAVEANKPVAIFLSNFSLRVTGSDDGATETINYNYCTSAHVVVGYGYKVDTYYNANNQVVATRTYLKVASGLETYKMSHLCLDGKSKVSRATAITIQ
ncbi:MAG: hypothetical protein K2N50_00995 [Clostridia bacterium]|nr:hypothetical protein [Clostridia bacterium]